MNRNELKERIAKKLDGLNQKRDASPNEKSIALGKKLLSEIKKNKAEFPNNVLGKGVTA